MTLIVLQSLYFYNHRKYMLKRLAIWRCVGRCTAPRSGGAHGGEAAMARGGVAELTLD